MKFIPALLKSHLCLQIVEDTAVVPDTPATQVAKTTPKTDPSTHKPTFETPSSVPPPNWQDAFGTSSPDEAIEPAEEEKPWVDDGTLPLDGEGNLPFYFLDAVEEPARTGEESHQLVQGQQI